MLLMIVPTMLAAAAAPAPANPIQPALSGQLECHVPNDQAKTCQSLAGYTRIAGNRYSNRAQVLLAPQGPVTLEVTSEVEVKDGAICGPLRLEDLNAGHVIVAGRTLSDAEAAPVKTQLAQAMGPMIGKQICSKLEPSGNGFTVKSSIDRTYRSDLDRPMHWVKPDEGYKVAP